jgi:hypothetical protein
MAHSRPVRMYSLGALRPVSRRIDQGIAGKDRIEFPGKDSGRVQHIKNVHLAPDANDNAPDKIVNSREVSRGQNRTT